MEPRDRRGEQTNDARIRLAVVYRVCQHWRAPIFTRLSAQPGFQLRVLHGRSIPGTKLINGKNLEGFDREEMPTLSFRARSSGREVTLVFAPTVFSSLRRYAPDVILVEGGSNIATNILVYVYAAIFRVPIVWWTLGILPGRNFRGVSRAYRLLVTALERRATALLGYSSVAMDYFQQMRYPSARTFRAVNCVDTERIISGLAQDRERSKQICAELGLDRRFVILCVGALTRAKHFDRLLDAFALLRKRHPTAYLIVVGEGPERANLERQAERLKIAAHVHFAGEVVEGVGAYYETADVFVLPSLGGLAISEAMTHSLPVICGRGDGCEVDLVINHETGYRFETDEDNEASQRITAALERLASDPSLRRRLGESARSLIDNTYNVEAYVHNIATAVRYAFCAGVNRKGT